MRPLAETSNIITTIPPKIWDLGTNIQTFRELIPKELNSGINFNFPELRLELNLF